MDALARVISLRKKRIKIFWLRGADGERCNYHDPSFLVIRTRVKLRGSRYMELLKSFFRNENQIYFKNDVTHVTFTISH